MRSAALSAVVLLVMVDWAFASPADVNIYHQIPGTDAIWVYCMQVSPGKAHQIFTPQKLAFGQHWGWGFTPNVLGFTKYYCDITWNGLSKRLRVWADTNADQDRRTRDPRPCTHCMWYVTMEGFYRMTSDHGEPPVLEVGWA